MSPKNITPKVYIKKVIGYSAILFAIISTLVIYYITSERDKDAQQIKNESFEERIPVDVKTFVEWEKHMNEKPSDVETHILNRRNKEIGDSLLILSKKQYAEQLVITEQLKVIDTFRIFLKAKDSKDSITEVVKQVSRDQRTDDMEVQKATMLLILKRMDALQDSIK